jgi:hypothetical protein
MIWTDALVIGLCLAPIVGLAIGSFVVYYWMRR